MELKISEGLPRVPHLPSQEDGKDHNSFFFLSFFVFFFFKYLFSHSAANVENDKLGLVLDTIEKHHCYPLLSIFNLIVISWSN